MTHLADPYGRHEYADAAMEQAQVLLATPEAGRRLGGRAARLAELAGAYFVPNIRGDVASIPKVYQDSEAIPVLPILWGEELRLDATFNSLTPAMRERCVQDLGAFALNEDMDPHELVEPVEGALRTLKNGVVTLIPPVGAIVNRRCSFIEPYGVFVDDSPVEICITQRPHMLLATDLPTRGATAVHELVHVDQASKGAVVTRSPQLGASSDMRELEAYEAGSVAEGIEGYFDTQRIVEVGRKMFTDPDKPYQATPELVDYLRRQGMDYLAADFAACIA